LRQNVITSCGTPEEQYHGVEEGLEVVVPIDLRCLVQLDVAEDLHTHDGVDEEQHAD